MSQPHPKPGHLPVLLDETLRLLDPKPGEVVVDCTVGLGGHAAALGERVGPTGKLVAIDLDPGNLERAVARLRERLDRGDRGGPEIIGHAGNFAGAPRILAERSLAADVVLADLGFSSSQMDDPERGLSMKREGPLDMRLSPSAPVSAAELVNTSSEADLAELIRDYGEEPGARRIARKIVEARQAEPIQTTSELASIVRAALPRSGPPRGGKRGSGGKQIDPATRTFQAIRIAVNDEIGSLHALLESIDRGARSLALARSGGVDAGGVGGMGGWLRPGARIGIISFHSLEDRPVKEAFASLVERGLATHVARKPVIASDGELATNPRARSAKLRVIRVGGGGG